MTVTINGEATIYTIDDGTEFSADIMIESGDMIELSYLAGAFQNEVTYELLNNNGDVIFADGPNPTEGDVFQFIGSCSMCGFPGNIIFDEILGEGVELSFTANDTTTEHIVYYGLEQLPFSDLIELSTINTNSIIIAVSYTHLTLPTKA